MIGTLPRADMRDVLLVRRTAGRPCRIRGGVLVLSSSRAASITALFLEWALPAQIREVNFATVRGNAQTRIRKLFEGEADGLVIAKAALDRLLAADQPEYAEARAVGMRALRELYWMIVR